MADPLAPGSVIGILGGGQLGKMLAQAAARLGFHAHVFAPDEDAPAARAASHYVKAGYTDAPAMTAFAEGVDVLTYEFESIPAESLTVAEQIAPLRPNRCALAATQDRLAERALLARVGAPCAAWARVDDAASLETAWHALSPQAGTYGMFLKTRRHGYDGKGQRRVRTRAELADAADWLGGRGAILECGIGFDFEFSLIGVRGRDGACAFYDPPRNHHRDGILALSQVPGGLDAEEAERARSMVQAIMAELGYIGVIAVEFFAVRGASEPMLVNEIAPRVHNSGHWTIEACAVSQFENHIRAITGWPLGTTARHADADMVNILGPEVHDWRALLADNPARSLHIYGKAQAAPGRKMGHYVDLKPLTRAP